MTRPLRVALFSDSHYEANGVARTTGALERYAARRGRPLLSVHAGPATSVTYDGSIVRFELRRWNPTSFGLEHDLRFDLAMWRYLKPVARALRAFKPDVLHFTGPSDIGQLGAYLGHRLSIPMVGSWHTNLHEYAARRLRLNWAGTEVRGRVRRSVEERALQACLLYYKIPRVLLAPNEELLTLLSGRTGRPAFLMTRGVDTSFFSPAKRRRSDDEVNIGYVGRLSREKNVGVLAALERRLRDETLDNVRFTIVGEGSEREWLSRNMQRATFTGVLRGAALAAAYADMDLFVFPSETETVGNVVLEAMASGVAVAAMAQGGPKSIAGSSGGAVLARDHSELIAEACAIAGDRRRRGVMRKAARLHAVSMSWDAVFDQVYRAYDAAVASAGAGAPSTLDDGLLEGANA